jgi:anti-sigma regulatory factor (Ser/Thr protein kinase)
VNKNLVTSEEFPFRWPKEIKNDNEGLRFLSEIYSSTNQLRDSKILFDFSDAASFSLDLCAPVGAIIDSLRRRNNVVNVVKVNEKLKNQFTANRFLQSLFPYYQIPVKPSYIMYKCFTNKQDDTFFDYVHTDLLNYSGIPAMTNDLKAEIATNIQEIYHNAYTHGDCSHVYTCGEYNRDRNMLTFTIADIGKTIHDKVKEYKKNELLTGRECIEWAVISGNTTRNQNIPGGLGIGLMRDFLKYNKGWLKIVSSNGSWREEETIISTDNDFTFQGTIVSFGINLSDNKIYL